MDYLNASHPGRSRRKHIRPTGLPGFGFGVYDTMGEHCIGEKEHLLYDILPRPERPRRVALVLDLEWPYKRHAGIFAGTQRYAQEQGWESTIDEYVAEKLPPRRTKSLPYDGVIARATRKLAERAARLALPVVNVWLPSAVKLAYRRRGPGAAERHGSILR